MEEILNNLTLYQKVALQGEVAEILSAATSDAATLYRLYYTIQHIPTDVAVPLVELAKELITIPGDKLDRVLLSISLNEFPEWLWVEKTISDIRVALNTCYQTPSIPVHLDTKELRRSIVKSAFVRVIRHSSLISKEAALHAISAVLEELDLAFLRDVCCSLQEELEGLEPAAADADLDDLFKIEIDCKRGLMSYVEETKMLKKLLLLEENPKQFMREMEAEREADKKAMEEIEGNGVDVIKSALEQMESIVKSARAQVQRKKETKKNKTYIVSKAFKGREQEASPLKEFKTADEARAFVKDLEEQYPELLGTCSFLISEKSDGREEEI